MTLVGYGQRQVGHVHWHSLDIWHHSDFIAALAEKTHRIAALADKTSFIGIVADHHTSSLTLA